MDGFGKGKRFGPGSLIAYLLIGGGVILFLDNLGILPFRAAGLFWPLVLIAWGAANFPRSKNPLAIAAPATAIVAGVLMILGSFHVLNVSWGTLWPLVMIAVGIAMLSYRVRWLSFRNSIDAGSQTQADPNVLGEFALFSSVKRRVETQIFEGGELSGVFGAIEIDLRRSAISSATGEAIIEANAAFAGIEIRVPETWRVVLQGTAVFGAYEDKTIPPRTEPGLPMPTLVIRGGTAFGAVIVQN